MPVLKRIDVNLNYEFHGHGSPVIFIHGVGVAGSAWHPQVDGLRDSFEIITFDNRGLGQSLPCPGAISIEAMAGDVQALMDMKKWESAHVVGHSMGGVIAQQFALDCPKRVRSLSLLCTFARGKDAARITPWVLGMTLRTRLGTRRMRRRAMLEMIWPADLLRAADTDKLAAQLAPLIGRDLADQPPILIKQVRALGRHNTMARLHELNGIPSLIISAEKDLIAPPVHGKMIAAGIPGASFELMKNASHGVTIHNAEEINRRLCEFFDSVEKQTNRGAGCVKNPGAN